MNISNFIAVMAQNAEVETPTLFPFPLHIHLIFSCLALVFFLFQFKREKKPYQLIMGIAIPFSLVIWLSENRTLFYAVGIAELAMLIAAFVTAVVFKNKEAEPAAGAEVPENSAEEASAEEIEDGEDQE